MTDAPGWVATLGRSVRVNEVSSGVFQLGPRAAVATIDLSSAPNTTTLLLSDSGRYIFKAASGQSVVVRQPSHVVVEGSLGSIEFDVAVPNSTPRFEGETRVLRLTEGVVEVSNASVEHLQAAGGTAAGDRGGIRHIELLDGARLPFPEVDRAVVDASTSLIHLDSDATVATLEFAAREPDSPNVWLRSESQPHRRIPRLDVDRLIAPAMTSEIELSNVSLSLARVEGKVSLKGTGTLRVPPGADVTDITVSSDISVAAGAGAALRRFEGHLRVGDCREVTVSAPPGRFYIFDGVSSSGTSPPDLERLAGATLRGVKVPDGAVGRQLLKQLRQAAVLDPTSNPFKSGHCDHASFTTGELAAMPPGERSRTLRFSLRNSPNWSTRRVGQAPSEPGPTGLRTGVASSPHSLCGSGSHSACSGSSDTANAPDLPSPHGSCSHSSPLWAALSGRSLSGPPHQPASPTCSATSGRSSCSCCCRRSSSSAWLATLNWRA